MTVFTRLRRVPDSSRFEPEDSSRTRKPRHRAGLESRGPCEAAGDRRQVSEELEGSVGLSLLVVARPDGNGKQLLELPILHSDRPVGNGFAQESISFLLVPEQFQWRVGAQVEYWLIAFL